ncbi:MAG: DUF262 domain-containing protein [Chloroflexi bacterium]|nr:DUF262 domain-containing protein [Chloroflexota bacterium]
MKADEMRLGPLLSGPKQFVVPYFQRAYSWRRHQWNTLFDDILELYELGSSNSHFLGSMVLLKEPDNALSSKGSPTLVIDGQQRIVTLSLFLAAIRDAAGETDPGFAGHLHYEYLADRAEDDLDYPKIQVTHQDRDAFLMAIRSADNLPPSPIKDAYRTFREALKEQLDKDLDLERLVHIVVAQLSFVAITLDAEDNPYRIFESLNAKGMPLTQGDLLRNYFFMRLPPGEHERWYTTAWSPMQTRLGERFDDYMRDFLLKDGQPIRPDEVYQEWRKRLGPLDEEGIRSVLRDLAEWSLEYDQILNPRREADADVRVQLQRLTAWSKTVPYQFNPLLLRLHADYRRGSLSADQVKHIFRAVESLFVRRLFASGQPRDENQLLIELYDQAGQQSDRAAAFVSALSRPQVGWPDDADFMDGIVRYPLYFASHPDQRKLILEALEATFEHRAAVRYEQLDLQLITPLLPRADWLAEVGVTEDQYWKLIGTLGNFTWVPRGRAPDLGVAERKKELLRMTRYGLELVKDFAQIERWTAAEIENRSRRLAARAIQIWPGPRRQAPLGN